LLYSLSLSTLAIIFLFNFIKNFYKWCIYNRN
jgi:hypothetical protein